MQLVNANGVDGEKITAWVKCAWAPKSHGHCAVQIDFPAPDRRPKDMLGVVRIVEEKAARAASLGATHLFLYAADDDVKRTFAAYLMPISAVSTATREAAQISPKLVKNGHSPCLYVYAAQSPRAELVAVVKKYSIDLLASPPGGRPGNDDAINDLDQVPAGSPVPAKLRVVGHVYQRDPAVRDFVLKRAAGTCEHCGQAGFLMENGSRFLEAHHIISLAQQGPDTVNNVVALCANHHREAHYGADKEKLEKAMLAALRRLNRKP